MGLNILSLFDGMSCGRIALERAGIKVNRYYASEIEPSSIKITQKNYPDTIQLGDITKLTNEQLLDLGEIDLLAFGFPCKNLSRTVINNVLHNQGLKGEQSGLFYDAIRVMNIVKPKYFLCENVESMKNEDKEIITETLGVEPIMIDSALVSAQTRKRYYWTNINEVEQPDDLGIVLRDIVLPSDQVEDKFWYKADFDFHGEDKSIAATLHINGHDILKRVNSLNGKSHTLTTCSGGNTQKKVYQDGRCRKLTPLEYERLQTVPEGYTEGVSNTNRYNMLGNGWTVDVIAHILKEIKDK